MPLPVTVPILRPGLTASHPAFGGGSSPPPPAGYTASAVHFGGATSLSRVAGIACTDNNLFSVVGWAKLSHADLDLNNNLFTVSPETNYSPNFKFQAGIGDHFTARLGVCNSDFSGSENCQASPESPPFPEDTWICIIATLDTSASAKGKFYYGDTDVTGLANFDPVGIPFTIATNGLPFYFGDDSFSDFVQGDYADWRIMPGISLLDGGGDIALATRRLFIDAGGKPVDPAAATDALGAPAILFSGDHSSFGTNQGTGGAFTLTGALTDASSSPSD